MKAKRNNVSAVANVGPEYYQRDTFDARQAGFSLAEQALKIADDEGSHIANLRYVVNEGMHSDPDSWDEVEATSAAECTAEMVRCYAEKCFAGWAIRVGEVQAKKYFHDRIQANMRDGLHRAGRIFPDEQAVYFRVTRSKLKGIRVHASLAPFTAGKKKTTTKKQSAEQKRAAAAKRKGEKQNQTVAEISTLFETLDDTKKAECMLNLYRKLGTKLTKQIRAEIAPHATLK